MFPYIRDPVLVAIVVGNNTYICLSSCVTQCSLLLHPIIEEQYDMRVICLQKVSVSYVTCNKTVFENHRDGLVAGRRGGPCDN